MLSDFLSISKKCGPCGMHSAKLTTVNLFVGDNLLVFGLNLLIKHQLFVENEIIEHGN